ncbi:hypothetical protein LTR47_002999 [Exophiala xenobiotica]|nr:hypothetical protein LTR47_002999 [Exophiala xenobiotica]KAK5255265.1 hypothetical protein LTS06_000678 [Exophiala xenobiotica]KAK5351414.1 hypothetical protein LTR61_004764 [Exophiala xenobiotica]KAK5383653.1 hypothetical protein LTR11_002662 [Exophiala xenobiotica]KAK5384938.1 hypothetical protein LTS03_002902 [Exophiala xenobiotica]
MSDQNYRKPLLFALAGATVLSVAFYTYTYYSTESRLEPIQPSSLHRSNAIRRPRHRRHWRAGIVPRTLDYDPTERAINNLERRNQTGEGYGEYHNKWFSAESLDTEGAELTLLPCKLKSIYDHLLQRTSVPLSPYQQDCLRLHIHGVFTQNFLREEFPEGYIIGDDAYIVARGLEVLGVAEEIVYEVVKAFDEGEFHLSQEWSPLEAPIESPVQVLAHTDGATEDMAPQDALQALREPRGDEEEEGESEISFSNNEDDPEGSQNMLDLLYHIAGEQARKEGYIHRGVECNSCGTHPIQGIRYHCANCFDFDLCESCEASSTHVKSHVFFKIRIPAPSRGNIKHVIPSWYPGDANAFPTSLPKNVSKPLLEQTKMDRTEMVALYEQFKCLAGHFWPTDPSGLGLAIDRKGFDAYFIPSTADKPSAANLIYDRIFAYYDTDDNGLIGFEEYIKGLARLQDKSRSARLERIFQGYDLDADGYVDRKDFLRMFRAYYALSKELSREMFNAQEDYGPNEEEVREVVHGSQPISAAFGGSILNGHESRIGQDKERQATGDLELSNGPNGVLQPDMETRGDRARAIGNVALGNRTRNHPFRSFRPERSEDEPVMLLPSDSNFMRSGMEDVDETPEEELTGPDPPLQTYGWPPPLTPEARDIIAALGREVLLEDITDPLDRTRVIYAQAERLDAEADHAEEAARTKAVEERWRRRQFYLDEEEGMTRPPGYMEPDSSDDEEIPSVLKKSRCDGASSPRRPSVRSRSSSKVRFDDSAIDTDYETRSNASSRSTTLNERWGGYELGQADADIGKDILYQAVQQGFNELLDGLFKEKEDEWVEVCRTRNHRHKFKREREEYRKALEAAIERKDEALKEADSLRTEELLRGPPSSPNLPHGAIAEPISPTVYQRIIPDIPDPDDHIELMFGNGLSKQNGIANGVEQDALSEVSYHDPTLPQFRPDHDAGPASPAPTPPPNPFSGDSVRSRVLYDLWLRHDAIEAEADERSGPGKLNFPEFRRKMVLEDEVGKALGVKGKSNGEDEQEGWESSADLGRLAFVGTWLEMASF